MQTDLEMLDAVARSMIGKVGCDSVNLAIAELTRLRAEKAQAKPPCNDTVLKSTIEDCEAFPGGSAHFSTDMICGYLRELRSLRAEKAALETVVAKQPKTRDGVLVTPGMELFYTYIVNDMQSWVSFAQKGEDPRFCFSTREAAEKSLREAGK